MAQQVYVTVGDSNIHIKDTNGNTLYVENVPATENRTYTINDCTVTLERSDNTTISTHNVIAEGTDSFIIPDSIVTVEDQNSTVLGTYYVKANSTKTITVTTSGTTNTDIEINGISMGSYSGTTHNIDVLNSDNNTIGSKVNNSEWLIADTQIDIYVGGIFDSTIYIPAGESDSINIHN